MIMDMLKIKKNKIFFGLFFNEIVLIKKVGFMICWFSLNLSLLVLLLNLRRNNVLPTCEDFAYLQNIFFFNKMGIYE
jgi:hypothetical protein